MKKEEYRRQCLLRSPQLRRDLNSLARLKEPRFTSRVAEIRERYRVDPIPLLRRRRDLLKAERELSPPRYMISPGWFHGSRLRDNVLNVDRRSQMFSWAKLWIPIYRDTAKDDLKWAEIRSLQARLYGRVTRTRTTELERRLTAWDYLRDGMPEGPSGLRKELHMPSQPNALRTLERAWQDITMTRFPGVSRALRLVGPGNLERPLTRHWASCERCRTGRRCSAAAMMLTRDMRQHRR